MELSTTFEAIFHKKAADFCKIEQLTPHSNLKLTCNCIVKGGIVKPDVVLYEEGLDGRVLEESVAAIRRADLLVIVGTSLAVYPAAGLIDYFQGNHLVIVNLSPTPRDRYADLCVQAKVGDVFDW